MFYPTLAEGEEMSLDGLERLKSMGHRPPPPRPPEWMNPGTCFPSGRDVVKNICHLPDGTVIYDILVPRTDWFGKLFGLERYETRIDSGQRAIEPYYCGSEV